ncbi:TPA: restriction endonuclease subunit S [Morganella morganii]|nr:restriction endonuclease subunit S [Morganella morganii subsp. morganii]
MTEQQLPEGWQMVKFGDIAKHISKRVEPSETDLEIYVGLEHLDSDSLKIKRHGTPSDVEGQKLLVKKGQIIFGKRRAYQRKVAVADWDCICSAHAMVLEANQQNVIPEFLPFFMQSDVFMNRAVAISEGSLSPTIKWKVLEQQCFELPPLKLQRSFLNILKKVQSIDEKSCASISLLDDLNKSLLTQLFKRKNTSWQTKPLGDLFEVQLGKMLSKKARQDINPKRYLGNANVQWGRFELTELKFMDFTEKEMSKFRLKKGDILVCEGGEIGRSAIWENELEECYYQKALHRLRLLNRETITPEFMLIYMDYMFNISREFSSQSMATTIAHIPKEKLINLPVSYPDLAEQNRIVNSVCKIQKAKVLLEEKVKGMTKIKQSILTKGE